MKIAITGANGRVGNALTRHFRDKGHEVIAITRQDVDLSSHNITADFDPHWDVLFHPAAMSSPDDCEDQPALAHQVNALAPSRMAAWCKMHSVRFIHFSTDYVFAGDHRGKCASNGITEPRTHYGTTKRNGELAVRSACPQAVIARVSWIYGAEKPGFVDAVITKLQRGEPITAIADKFSLPTRMSDLASWLEKLLSTSASGIIHACHRGDPVSWHGIVEFIAHHMISSGLLPHPPQIIASTLNEATNFRARRPVHTAMDNASLEHWIGPVNDWTSALVDHLIGKTTA